MRFGDLITSTLHTLWAQKLRVFLTMFGIAWGIVSITLMVAAGEGLRVGQAKQVEGLGKDLMIVWAGRTSLQVGGAQAGRRLRWNYDDVATVKAYAPDCKYVLPEWGRTAAVRSDHGAGSLLVTGSLPGFEDLRTLTIAQGRFYNDSDVAASRRVAFIGSDAKKQLFAERDAIGHPIYVDGNQYFVIGVMKAKDQDSSYDGRDISKVFVPFTAMMRDLPPRPPWEMNALDQMLVSPRSVAQHDACELQLKKTLARIHDFDYRDKEAISIWDTVKDAQQFATMTNGMQAFLGIVGLVTLVLGGIGVMNVMLVAVRERTREIGIRKAVGSTAGAILAQFFLEALIIVLISGGAGLGLAYAICAGVNMMEMPDFFAGLLPTWKVSFYSLAVLGVVAIASAIYPARQAASIDPIEALRFEAGG